MFYIEGEEVLTSYVIVKGKKVFYFLSEVRGLYSKHIWSSPEMLFCKTHGELCLFKTEAEAKACLAQLPQQKMFQGAYVKLFKMKII